MRPRVDNITKFIVKCNHSTNQMGCTYGTNCSINKYPHGEWGDIPFFFEGCNAIVIDWIMYIKFKNQVTIVSRYD